MTNSASTTSIFTATSTSTISGFTFRLGYVALVSDTGEILAATNGWECNDQLYVYRPNQDGTWVGNWEGPETFPVQEVLEAIQNYQEETEIKKAFKYAEGKKLKVGKDDIIFTDIVPGEKSGNGGEYGFYTRYTPTGHPGIYSVSTETTCDFDACGTGSQGIRALTIQEYRRLKKASNKIEAAGSQY